MGSAQWRPPTAFGQVWGIAVSSGWVVLRSGRLGRLARQAVWAGAARADSAGEEVAVRAAALVEVAGFALGAFVDDADAGAGAGAHRVPPNGVTPAPANAWDRRTDSPLVCATWAWCRSRS